MIYENHANTAENNGPLALVLGANGGVGSHVLKMLLQRGWQVRALTRQRVAAGASDGIERVTGDVMNRQDVMDAAKGATLIVHAVNPPGYRDWERQVLPMLDNTIAAAEACGARILLPGTVYNFGPDAFPLLREDSPQQPFTRKGALRVEMERRLKMASMRGVPVLIVRAGDFFGPDAKNNWFSQMLVRPGKPVRSVQNPAARHVGHQWAYLPDVAETIGRLLDRSGELPAFAVYHMEGFWDFDGLQLVGAIERAVGRPVKMRRMSWLAIKLAAPFVPVFREVLEMQYLWQMPIRMSNRKLTDFLGAEPKTPVDIAVSATLTSLGCIEQPRVPASLHRPVDAGGRV